ncbi:VirB2 family type IV secretion system major pilin TrwL [Bartonella henselae]|uniref:TrwL2 protein n=1 Tax=Bartonella henselae TaxID=38323 RepID=B0RK91_BARHN|nr:VirB2 family type IV secretion system major pilin TrwL [Bartonella henselae]ETS09513.1 hypothetical protein Q653_00585 [Bartonella henselae JK 42]ETS12541.1 hypothetical protein Q652_00715 [Bartonella henselae JK 41]KEC58893.1 hypothetical protein O97_00192 [Bartonella henselae str. Zeus]KEC60947.1 hypothetical protein O95_00268 [Bartonella henselae JK 53]MDM9983472.1 VirB2 family type IV secretion system major pilin TrwL [Bartonella henselae]
MKQSNIFKTVVNNKVIALTTMTSIFYIAYPIHVQAEKLQNAKNALKTFKEQLITIVPIASAVILLCLAIGYAARYIEKDTFLRWAIGVVIAGSAAEIANLLLTGT